MAGIDEALRRMTERRTGPPDYPEYKPTVLQALDRPEQMKATEVITSDLLRIGCAFEEIEQRLNEVLSRFGGGIPTEEKQSTSAPTPSNFLGAMNSYTANLERALKRISALTDRFEELV